MVSLRREVSFRQRWVICFPQGVLALWTTS
jgi:hypothetical protein